MKLAGEAVAEVLRNLPSTRWFTWTFGVNVFGVRPFQAILNLAYAILADVRPVFGCESCGTPSPWCVQSDGSSNGQLHYLVRVIMRVQVPISPRCRARGVPRKRIRSEFSCST